MIWKNIYYCSITPILVVPSCFLHTLVHVCAILIITTFILAILCKMTFNFMYIKSSGFVMLVTGPTGCEVAAQLKIKKRRKQIYVCKISKRHSVSDFLFC